MFAIIHVRSCDLHKQQNRQNDINHREHHIVDDVLDLTLGYILFIRYPELREGKLTRIRAAVGYEPRTPIEDGLRRLVDWVREYYKPDGAEPT